MRWNKKLQTYELGSSALAGRRQQCVLRRRRTVTVDRTEQEGEGDLGLVLENRTLTRIRSEFGKMELEMGALARRNCGGRRRLLKTNMLASLAVTRTAKHTLMRRRSCGKEEHGVGLEASSDGDVNVRSNRRPWR
jgi:hypothetical protein